MDQNTGPYSDPHLFASRNRGCSVFVGTILGLSLNGLLIILRLVLPKTKRFGLAVLAGIASPPTLRVSGVLLVVFTEELWRALCHNSLMADGFSGSKALIATSIANALAYLPWGAGGGLGEGTAGKGLGTLFLFNGSILVPLAAHLVLQVGALLTAIAAAPDSEPGAMSHKPFAKCPACGARLSLQQVNLSVNEAFSCPNCRTRLTSCDRRRSFFRWGVTVLAAIIWLATSELFPDLLFHKRYWNVFPVFLLAMLGVGPILYFAIPMRLEFGDPDLVGLNLNDEGISRSDDEKRGE